MPTTNLTWTNLTNATAVGNDLSNNNAGLDECYTNAAGTGDSGGSSVESIASAQDWEFRCTFGPNPSGRTFVGMNDTFSIDFADWQYCLHVSTELNTSGTPHPANSVFVYEGPVPNKTYLDGVWSNSSQMLRLICRNNQVKYYLDCTYIYTSPTAPTYPLYAQASMACHDSTVLDAKFITGPGVGTGTAGMTEGAESGDACSPSWVIPTPTAMPQPPTAGAPRAVRFQETAPVWGEFGHAFGDNSPNYNTIQTSRIRRFEVDWLGLDASQAAVLDAHWESTRGGLSFSITNPHTAETVTGCRYEAYTRSTHQRYWSQSRSASIIKYTA